VFSHNVILIINVRALINDKIYFSMLQMFYLHYTLNVGELVVPAGETAVSQFSAGWQFEPAAI
jgi:hypothetical protein